MIFRLHELEKNNNLPCAGEVVVFVWQTGCSDMRIFIKINIMIELHNSNVIIQSASIKFRMNMYSDNISFNIWIKFNVMIDIPLA